MANMIHNEHDILRDMAKEYRDIAASDQMKAKARRWKDHLAGYDVDRKPVLLRIWRTMDEIFPEPPVNRDPFLAGVEKKMRWDIFTTTLGDDTCLFPYWECPAAVELANPPLYGLEIKKIRPEEKGGAWKTVPPLKTEEDLDRLRMPLWRLNREETDQRMERLDGIFGDILPIKLTGGAPVVPTFDQVLEELMGFNELLLNVALNPDRIHRFMAYMRDRALAAMDWNENSGLLRENNDYHKYNSHSLKKDRASPVTYRDLWIWTNSQIFGSVGPEHFNELLLAYQKPVFERMGAVSYGCCEDLTRKIDPILTIPNLKIFVSSHWTDLAVVAPKCAERDVCIEWRQLATDMMGEPDWDHWEAHLRRGLEITKGQRSYIVLQEVETTEGNVDKFRRWSDLAVKMCEETA